MENALPETVKCPFCAEHIQADAVICRFCNRQVSIPDANTLGHLQKLSPTAYWGGPEGTPTIAAVQPDAAVQESIYSQVPVASHLPTADQPLSPQKKFSLNVLRDVLVNLAITSTVAFIVGFYLGVLGLYSETMLNAGGLINLASLLGNTLAYTIVGSWGREPRDIRVRRLRIGAIFLAVIDVVICGFQVNNSSNLDDVAHPVASFLGSMVGVIIGTAIRCAIGYGLSLVFAKPREEVTQS